MSRPIDCDGPDCGARVNARGTLLVLQVYPPPAPNAPDNDPGRVPLILDFCTPLCLANWALSQNVTPFPAG